MRVGMVCYASLGGSGVVATELARALAGRGHDVHSISSERPFRWQEGVPRPDVPRRHRPVVPAVSRAAVPAGARQHHRARLRRAASRHRPCPLRRAARDRGVSRRVRCLRGSTRQRTAADRDHAARHRHHARRQRHAPTRASWRFQSSRSDVVTAVSQSLKADTVASLGIRHPIEVIPNFLDCERLSPARRRGPPR